MGIVEVPDEHKVQQQFLDEYMAQLESPHERKGPAPQQVPYVHEEIPAEPYIHQEIAAEPYVHQEPPLSPEALGNVAYAAPAVPTGYAAGPIWSGACINNLGQSVPCRQ